MTNSEVEDSAIKHVMAREDGVGRRPEDVRHRRQPYDIASDTRKIEVKGFGGSVRGVAIAFEERQVQAAREDPDNYYVYVVENVANEQPIEVCVLHGAVLHEMLDRAKPCVTYWPIFRAGDYDHIDEGIE